MRPIRPLLSALALVAFCAPPAFAQDVGADIPITSAWTDITVLYPSLANTPVYVQDKSSATAFVAFSASATPPGGGGVVLLPSNQPFTGQGAHIWVRSAYGTTGAVSAGIAPIATSQATVVTTGPLSQYASGTTVDMRNYSVITLKCYAAPSAGSASISPDGTNFYPQTVVLNNVSGVSATQTINAVGTYTEPGGGYAKFTLTGGSCYVSGSN